MRLRGRVFCSLEIEDAFEDERFDGNPLVKQEPRIRFYAGAPIITKDGYAIGTVAVLDRVPKKLEANQQEQLHQLAVHTMLQLDLRREAWHEIERFRAFSEASPIPIVVVDIAGAVELRNAEAEYLFGWSAEEVIGKFNPTVPPREEAGVSASKAKLEVVRPS